MAGHTVAQSRDKRSRELLEARGSRATAPKLPEIVAFFCFPVIRRMLRRSMSFLPVPVTRKAPTDLAPAPSPLVHDFSSFALPSRIRVRRTVRGSTRIRQVDKKIILPCPLLLHLLLHPSSSLVHFKTDRELLFARRYREKSISWNTRNDKIVFSLTCSKINREMYS